MAHSFSFSLCCLLWEVFPDTGLWVTLLWDLMTLCFPLWFPGVSSLSQLQVQLGWRAGLSCWLCALSLAQGQVGLSKIFLNEWMSDSANVSNLCYVQGNTLLLHCGFWLLVLVISQCLTIKRINPESPLYNLMWWFVSSIGQILKYHC